MRLSLKTAPAARALDWATQIRPHLRIDSDEEQAYIESIYVRAATDFVESLTGRQLITATYYGHLDAFPDGRVITLPRPPLQSVTSIKYLDDSGVLLELSADLYTVDIPAGPKCSRGRIILDYGESWPATRDDPDAVTIEFVGGYGSSYASIPGGLTAALLLHVGDAYAHREESAPGVLAAIPQGVISHALQYLSEG
jgi:uncharacterized phiE125 gp8 family phage protein